MQGPIPPVLDLSSFPTTEETIRVTHEFCDKYRALRKEVDILREENNRLTDYLGAGPRRPSHSRRSASMPPGAARSGRGVRGRGVCAAERLESGIGKML